LLLKIPDPENKNEVREILACWYSYHASVKFSTTLNDVLHRFKNCNIKTPELVMRRMARRWGSYTPGGKVFINPEIIKAPSKCIEYVIVHELCHVVQPNHNQAFYQLLNRIMPDWEKWKLRLERVMA